MTDHTALISSLEKASEGSRELDGRVYAALEGLTVKRMVMGGPEWDRRPVGMRTDKGDVGYHTIPHPTTSLDAIMALIERKLPGWHRQSGTEPGGATASAWLTADDGRVTTGEQFAKTEPLALCIALLHALQHQGGGNG